MSEIEQYKERLCIALNAAKVCIFEVDLTRQLYTFFENAESIFGVSGEDILKDVQPYSALDPEEYRRQAGQYFSHPDDMQVIEKAFACVLSGKPAIYEARMKAGNAQFVWCQIHAVPVVENGIPLKMIGVITDITEAKEKLKQATCSDDFTGLYNKVYATTSIKDCLSKGEGEHALILMDIDDFKRFNDTYGHAVGDRVIQTLSRRIKNTFKETDIAGRFGGDEFIILVQDISDRQSLLDQLEGLTQFQVDQFVCTTSLGVSLFPQDATEFNELFGRADRALYHAKNRKEKFSFSSEMNRSEG